MAYRYGTRRPALRRRTDRSVSMTARKPGPCAACEVPIRPGDAIYWWPSTGAAFHAGCTGEDAATAPADAAVASYVAAGLGEDEDVMERRQAARDEADYRQGLADGARYSSDRRMYGEALAEQWAMDAEMFAYNHGLDD